MSARNETTPFTNENVATLEALSRDGPERDYRDDMRQRDIQVALAFTVGAAAVLLVWWIFRPAPSSEPSETAASVVTTTIPLREQAALQPFLDAFEASRTGTYKIDGRLEITEPGVEAGSSLDVTHVRRGRDAIEITGTSQLVTVDGRQQSCEVLPGAETVCGAITDAAPVAETVAALAALFEGDEPDYLLYDDEPNCWQLVATSSPAPTLWGQSTTICFDPETGAIVRQITSATNGVRTFVANTITAEVDDADLAPPNP